MRYVQTTQFAGDRRRLTDAEFRLFVRVVHDSFIPAAERCASQPGSTWPAALRVKAVRGAPGIWEMTWSFAAPAGRATFEWIRIDGAPAIRWRRVGGHAIFGAP